MNGVTCSDCNFNYNGHTEPHYTIQSQLILYKPNPFINIQNINSEIPASYLLEQNYPNPFNPSTTIQFEISKASFVRLYIYDVQGKLVENIFEGNLNPGSFKAQWNAGDKPSGIYIYKLEAGDFSSTKRMMLVK